MMAFMGLPLDIFGKVRFLVVRLRGFEFWDLMMMLVMVVNRTRSSSLIFRCNNLI